MASPTWREAAGGVRAGSNAGGWGLRALRSVRLFSSSFRLLMSSVFTPA